MAEFIETIVKTVTCPYCAGAKVVKNGTQKGEQRYMCRGCDRTFTESGKLHGHQFTTEQIGAAIRMFYSGTSYKQIAEHMEDIYDIPEPSKPAIYYWVRDYTDAAVERMKDYPADTSPHWVGDESTVDVGGEQYWNWNIMDKGTRYLLASHLSKERDARAAKAVIRKALAAAEKPPKTFTTDKWRSYIPAIKDLMPEDNPYPVRGAAGRNQQQPLRAGARHIQAEGENPARAGQQGKRATLPGRLGVALQPVPRP